MNQPQAWTGKQQFFPCGDLEQESLLYCVLIYIDVLVYSYNAMVLLSSLCDVAKSGTTILLSLHQPNAIMFEKIDYIILLKEGRCQLQGRRADIPRLLAQRGYPVPADENPADWMLTWSVYKDDNDNEDTLRLSGVAPSWVTTSARSLSTRSSLKKNSSRQSVVVAPPQRWEELDESRLSLVAETMFLLKRECRHVLRSRKAMVSRMCIVIGGTSILAIAFAGVANSDETYFQSHVGALFYFLCCSAVTSPSFMLEFIARRPLFEREYKTGHYRLLSYSLCHGVVEVSQLFIQALISMLIAYYGIGFQGRLWYLFFVFFSFAWALVSLCIAMGAFVHDGNAAKEFSALAIFPQSLFCGFYVQIEDLPQWLQWVPYIMPLTYTFRLGLEEEFSSCVPSTRDEQVVMCLEELANVLPPGDAVHNNESTLTLSQTGIYIGSESIEEYASLLSTMARDVCVPAGVRVQLAINSVSKSSCDITFATVIQGTWNDGRKTPSGKFVSSFGERISLKMRDGMQAVTENTHVFWANPLEPWVDDIINFEKVPSIVCDTLFSSCDGQYIEFDNLTECVDAMSLLPAWQVNAKSEQVLTGNSTGCRYVHQFMAKNRPEIHCPHISFASEPDPTENYMCDDKVLNKDYYNFTQEDLNLFQEVAIIYGLHEASMFRALAPNEVLEECATNDDIFDALLASVQDAGEFEQMNLLCAAVFDANNVTSDLTATYWGVLWSLIIIFRLVTAATIHRHATNPV